LAGSKEVLSRRSSLLAKGLGSTISSENRASWREGDVTDKKPASHQKGTGVLGQERDNRSARRDN